MTTLRQSIAVLIVLATPMPLWAQVDAPTGTYKGTLVHERKEILKQSVPPRVVSFKQKTKVTGFGYVPQGSAHTFIRLILPPGAVLDVGRDRELTVDFNSDPPVYQIGDQTNVYPFPFPTITVVGNAVTVSTFVGVNTADYGIEDVTTLSLKLSKP